MDYNLNLNMMNEDVKKGKVDVKVSVAVILTKGKFTTATVIMKQRSKTVRVTSVYTRVTIGKELVSIDQLPSMHLCGRWSLPIFSKIIDEIHMLTVKYGPP